VANLIREGTTYKLTSVLQTGKKLGMIMMDESLKRLIKEGKLTKDHARGVATNHKLFN
jgi:twitching motility protein PilT